ncbi:MAG TPA: hypothetical protein VNJ54_01330 [Plantibacter sp.]|uniref:hypothetical protein n=1 Tax=Plantibacter sp. TaxID=1871045 RepID=UPI002CA04C64|nr:hypothetical protein [Plantibacter sp.]
MSSVPPTLATPGAALSLAQKMAAPPVRRTRAQHAYELQHGTRFSDTPHLRRNAGWLIREIKRYPELWDDLERETTDPSTYEKRTTGKKHTVGRDRIPGHWALIGCAWIISKQPDVQVFHDAQQENRFWQDAGFEEERMPGYGTTHARLVELGDYIDGIDNARRKLWRLACHSDERVARHVHIDATATEAHARLHHECEDGAWCEANGGKKVPKWVERLDVGNANTSRQNENKEAPPEEEEEVETLDGDPAEDAVLGQTVVASTDPFEDLEEIAIEELEDDEPDEPIHPKYARRLKRLERPDGPKEIFIRMKPGGPKHRFTTRDVDAGFRVYTDPKSGKRLRAWLGFLNMRAVDDYTGAEIASLHLAADEAESSHFVALIERVREILGFYPEAVVCDRGPNIRPVRRACERLRIGMVAPFRKPNASVRNRSDVRQVGVVDEYGYCYCDFCGSPGTRHRYKRRNGIGYTTYVCANPNSEKCRTTEQSKRCDTEPLFLGVLSHEDELYWELRGAGKQQERAHRVARARYSTGANNVDTRPKRIGIDFLELRSSLSHFVEVFRLCVRQGWLDPASPQAKPSASVRRKGGKNALEVMRRLRRLAGLLLPQGKAAAKLDLLWDGVLPEGWVPIKQRRKEMRARNGAAPEPAPEPAVAADPDPF